MTEGIFFPPSHQHQHLPPQGQGWAEPAGHGGDAGTVLLICWGERVLLDVRGRAEGAGRVRRAGVRGDDYPWGGDTAYQQKIWCRHMKRGKAKVCLLFGVTSARTGPVFPASPSLRRWHGWVH